MAHPRQSRPDSGPGFKVIKVLETLKVLPLRWKAFHRGREAGKEGGREGEGGGWGGGGREARGYRKMCRPYSGLGLKVNALQKFQVVGSSLGRGYRRMRSSISLTSEAASGASFSRQSVFSTQPPCLHDVVCCLESGAV